MKIVIAFTSNTLRFLKGAAIITISTIIGFASYHLYEISVFGDSVTPSPRIPLFFILGGLIAALGFLIVSIYRNREARTLLKKLNYRGQEIAKQCTRIKILKDSTDYKFSEFIENPFNP